MFPSFAPEATVRQHLSKYEGYDKEFVAEVVRYLYADDFASGSHGVDSAFVLYQKLKKVFIKGQLQRFHKLISNDRIWPSEHGFEVIFGKSLFVFEISAFKVKN